MYHPSGMWARAFGVVVFVSGCGGSVEVGARAEPCSGPQGLPPRVVAPGTSAPGPLVAVGAADDRAAALLWHDDDRLFRVGFDAWGAWQDTPLESPELVREGVGSFRVARGPDEAIGLAVRLGISGPVALFEVPFEADSAAIATPATLDPGVAWLALGARDRAAKRLVAYHASLHFEAALWGDGAFEPHGSVGCGGARTAVLPLGEGQLVAMGHTRPLEDCASPTSEKSLVEVIHLSSSGERSLGHQIPWQKSSSGSPVRVSELALLPRSDGALLFWSTESCPYGYGSCSLLGSWLQRLGPDGRPRDEPKPIATPVLALAALRDHLAIVARRGDGFEIQLLDDEARVVVVHPLDGPPAYFTLAASREQPSLLVASSSDEGLSVRRVDCLLPGGGDAGAF